LDEIKQATKTPADTIKDRSACIHPSTAPAKTKEGVEQHDSMNMLWADVDSGNLSLDEIKQRAEAYGIDDYIVYSTASANRMKRDVMQGNRWRVLCSLAEAVSCAEWYRLQVAIAEVFNGGAEAFRVQQIMYLPTNPDSGYYEQHISSGEPLNIKHLPTELTALLEKIERTEKEQQAAAQSAPIAPRKVDKVQGGIIDLVNAAYPLESVLGGLGYKYYPRAGRWLHPNSTSGTPGVLLLSGRYYSHHSLETDSLADKHTHDAFDVLCHWEHGGDVAAAVRHYANELDPQGQNDRQREYMREQALLKACDGFNAEDTSSIPKLKFNLTPAVELLTTPKPLKWIIKYYLPPESQVFVFGPPAAGKSLVVIDWACCIATGNDWHGHKVTQGAVIYVAGEGHFGIRRRLKAWALHNDISLEDAPLAVSDMGADMTDPAFVDSVIEAIDIFSAEYGAPVLVIIDTLHRNLGSGDENSAQDMGIYFQQLDRIKVKYKCSMVTVHHSGHAESDRGRGSSSIRAAVEVEYQVEPKQNERLMLTNKKMKDGQKPNPTGFSIEEVELPWKDEDGCFETSVTIDPAEIAVGDGKIKKLPDNVKLGIETLHEAIRDAGQDMPELDGKAANIESWREVFYRKHTGDNTETKKKAFQRARADMVRLSLSCACDDWYTLTAGDKCDYAEARCLILSLNLMHPSKQDIISDFPFIDDRDTGHRRDMTGTLSRYSHLETGTGRDTLQ
jgi:hypothetical protein